MTLFDVNVLVAAVRTDHPLHDAAVGRLEKGFLEGDVLLWHPHLGLSMTRIACNPKVFAQPLRAAQCFAFIDYLLKFHQAEPPRRSEAVWMRMVDLVQLHQIAGPNVTDAYWAALAIEHDATLVSIDKGFGKFNDLKFVQLRAG